MPPETGHTRAMQRRAVYALLAAAGACVAVGCIGIVGDFPVADLSTKDGSPSPEDGSSDADHPTDGAPEDVSALDVSADSSQDASEPCGALGEACCTGTSLDAGDASACTGSATCCGGKCVDTAVSSSNCGACAQDCFGAQCSGGLCQPVGLVTYTGKMPTRLLVDDTNVYWLEPGIGQVAKCAKTGCAAVSVIASEGVALSDFLEQEDTSATGRIFWQQAFSKAVRFCNKADGSGLGTVTLPSTPVSFAVQGSSIFWSDPNGAVSQTALDDAGASLPLGTVGGPVRRFDVAASRVFYNWNVSAQSPKGGAWGSALVATAYSSQEAASSLDDFQGTDFKADSLGSNVAWDGPDPFSPLPDGGAPTAILSTCTPMDGGMRCATSRADVGGTYLGGFVFSPNGFTWLVEDDAFHAYVYDGNTAVNPIAAFGNVATNSVSNVATDGPSVYFAVTDISGKTTVYRLARYLRR